MRAAARMRGAKPVPLGIRASSTIVQTVEQKRSPNVIGVLKGTDTARALIYTAHYDHFGMRAPRPDDKPDADRIFNGAIDNASGLCRSAGDRAGVRARGHAPGALRATCCSRRRRSRGCWAPKYFAGAAGAARGAVARQHQHRQLEHGGPHQGPGAPGRRTLDAGQACRDDCREPRPRDRTGSRARPRLLLPLRSLPAGEDRHPRAVAVRTRWSTSARIPATRRRSATSYNDVDYHQPSDEFRSTWDMAGAIEDMRLLAELGWAIANSSEVPAYNAGEQFARPRQAATR